MLAAAAKRTKRTLFDDPYRTLVSNSNKSNNNNIKKNHSLCQFALETLDDKCLETHSPLEDVSPFYSSKSRKLKSGDGLYGLRPIAYDFLDAFLQTCLPAACLWTGTSTSFGTSKLWRGIQ